MIQILAEAFFGDIGMDVAYDQIPSRAYANLVGNMTRQDELTVVPYKFELRRT